MSPLGTKSHTAYRIAFTLTNGGINGRNDGRSDRQVKIYRTVATRSYRGQYPCVVTAGRYRGAITNGHALPGTYGSYQIGHNGRPAGQVDVNNTVASPHTFLNKLVGAWLG